MTTRFLYAFLGLFCPNPCLCMGIVYYVACGALYGLHSGLGLLRNHPRGWINKKNKYDLFTDLNIRDSIAARFAGVNVLYISIPALLSSLVLCTCLLCISLLS